MLREKKFSRGGCNIEKLSPAKEDITAQTKSLNIYISFEEALKLSLALQDRLLELNRYDRRIKENVRTCVNLTLHFDNERLVVNKGSL